MLWLTPTEHKAKVAVRMCMRASASAPTYAQNKKTTETHGAMNKKHQGEKQIKKICLCKLLSMYYSSDIKPLSQTAAVMLC